MFWLQEDSKRSSVKELVIMLTNPINIPTKSRHGVSTGNEGNKCSK